MDRGKSVLLTAFEDRHPILAYRAPAVLYAILIFIVSAIPGQELPQLPFISFDKVVHTIEFGLLGILVFRAFRFPRPVSKPYLATVFLCVGIAASDELHQLFVPGRYASMADFLCDAIGVIVFTGISAFIHRKASVDIY